MSDYGDVLAGGAWVRRGAVLVWEPREPERPPAPTSTLTPADVAQMIACPVCLAKVCQSCRTAGGNWTEHKARLIPQRCPCGALLASKKIYCEDCRAEARRATYWRREVATPTRQRRRSA